MSALPISTRGDLEPIRRQRAIGRRRVALIERQHTLLDERTRVDSALFDLVERRAALNAQLAHLYDQLWLPLVYEHGRRPPRPDQLPLAPQAHDAQPIAGRRLRALCIAILRRHGPQHLPDLHSLLHHYGHSIYGECPVKALADAMAYETDAGRAERIERGHDAACEGRPSRVRLRPWDEPIDPLTPWWGNDAD